MFGGHKNFFQLLVILLLFSITTSCNDRGSESRPVPSVDTQEVNIVRFERLICQQDDTLSASTIDGILRQYPVFTDVFFNQVIFPRNKNSIALGKLISHFCAAPVIQHLIDTTRILFPELHTVEQKLGRAFGYFHYYFPDKPIPGVFTYVSEFGIGTFTVDTRVLGIGLDFFLGTDYPYYDPAVFPDYLVQTMTPEYIPAKSIHALAEALIPPVTTGNMLDYMIRNGKSLYLGSIFLPEESMYLHCQYTVEEMEWVRENELNIWSYLINLGYFYESDQRKFKKFIDFAPNTPGMPKEAPGGVANWIGYRIVESYMNHHPDVSVMELTANTDFQSIMDQSNYKPPRPD